MRIAAALVAGTIVSAAHAQYFEVVINGPQTVILGEIVDYSVWLRDGHLFPDFVGWSSFAGRMNALGTHNIPDEATVGDQTGTWAGRRSRPVAPVAVLHGCCESAVFRWCLRSHCR